jgi:hypothetical protein
VELRKLKALLSALQSAGVTSYREGDLTLTLGAAPMQVSGADVEGAEATWKPDAPMGLADEVARIQRQYQPKPGKSRAQ